MTNTLKLLAWKEVFHGLLRVDSKNSYNIRFIGWLVGREYI